MYIQRFIGRFFSSVVDGEFNGARETVFRRLKDPNATEGMPRKRESLDPTLRDADYRIVVTP